MKPDRTRAEPIDREQPGRATRVAAPGARARPPAGAPAVARDPYLGAMLGSYRVLERIGEGGMGHVYRAEHVKLRREVALKVLRTDGARRREAVARFFQEARAVNRVRHRNVVEITDLVELADGTTFIVMELLRGVRLGTWARAGIDLPRALPVLTQICDGLAAAHQVAVVHRDLKPDNVIIVQSTDGEEVVKLLDFGVVKLLDLDEAVPELDDLDLHAGAVIGTPAYMSPEQAGGMEVDERSDLYALGAIMYELFCGHPPFRGRSLGDYVRAHLTEIPVPPRQTPSGASIDPRLESVIMKCLEKTPQHRFSSAIELRDALRSLHPDRQSAPVATAPSTWRGVPPWVWLVMAAAAASGALLAVLVHQG